MKRYGYIYEKVYTRENISAAIDRAARKKRKRHDVKRVLANREDAIDEIQYLLITQTYKPSPYREKIVREGTRKKERHILVPRFFPDQIIQWALLLQAIPCFSRGMDSHVCGSVPKRGKDKAKRYIERWLRQDPKGTKYCLQLDTHQFYPSVNHDILKAMLRRLFKDEKLLRLLSLIIDSADGLPVGNVTSQWLANYYFQGLDHYVKEQLHVRYYIRYMDDMILLGSNKRKLGRAREEIETYLKNIGLTLNPKWQKYQVDARGIDFLGYRFFHNKTILRRSLMLRITRKARHTSKKKSWDPHNCQSIISYLGWFKGSNNYGLYQKWVKPYIRVKYMKGVISRESIKHNDAGKGVPGPQERNKMYG